MSLPLLLIGCGGHARSLIDLVESSTDWHVQALVGLPDQVGEELFGYPVVGSDQDLSSLRQDFTYALLAIGQIGHPDQRKHLANHLTRLNYEFPSVISGRAHVSPHAKIGVGVTVGHGVIVNAGACVGNHCILNSNALIEHDSSIGDFSHISTGALINGGVKIGHSSFVGSGSVVREGVILPPSVIISAGKRVMGWPMRESLDQ